MEKFYGIQYGWSSDFRDLYEPDNAIVKHENICFKLLKFDSKSARNNWAFNDIRRKPITELQAKDHLRGMELSRGEE